MELQTRKSDRRFWRSFLQRKMNHGHGSSLEFNEVDVNLLYTFFLWRRGGLWLVPWPPDRAVRVRALAGARALRCVLGQDTLSANLIVWVSLRWTRIPSGERGSLKLLLVARSTETGIRSGLMIYTLYCTFQANNKNNIKIGNSRCRWKRLVSYC